MTDVAVVNAALSLLGEGSLADLNGTDKVTVRAVALYEPARQYVLATLKPRCAIRYAEVTPATGTLPDNPEFANLFELPSGTLRLTGVFYPGTGPDLVPVDRWRRIGDYAAADPAAVVLSYVSNLPVDEWDPVTTTALQQYLAMQLAFALVKSVGVQDRAENRWERTRREANTMAGQEQTKRRTYVRGLLEAAHQDAD